MALVDNEAAERAARGELRALLRGCLEDRRRRRAGWLARERDPYFLSPKRKADERPLRPPLRFGAAAAPRSGGAIVVAGGGRGGDSAPSSPTPGGVFGASAGHPPPPADGDRDGEWLTATSPLPYDLRPLIAQLA